MSGEAETLPLAHVKRVVKAKLAEVTAGSGAAAGGEAKKEVTVQKDALAALAEAGRIFIHYLTGTANELCQEGKRLTINADDVLRALDEVEFSEFSQPLREALAGACVLCVVRASDSSRRWVATRCWDSRDAAPLACRPPCVARRSVQGCQRGEGGQQGQQEAQGKHRGRGRRWGCRGG